MSTLLLKAWERDNELCVPCYAFVCDMSVGVKAFLYKDWTGDPVEIRRFSIDRDVAACYDYLTQKLCHVFRTLCADCIEIYWEG